MSRWRQDRFIWVGHTTKHVVSAEIQNSFRGKIPIGAQTTLCYEMFEDAVKLRQRYIRRATSKSLRDRSSITEPIAP